MRKSPSPFSNSHNLSGLRLNHNKSKHNSGYKPYGSFVDQAN